MFVLIIQIFILILIGTRWKKFCVNQKHNIQFDSLMFEGSLLKQILTTLESMLQTIPLETCWNIDKIVNNLVFEFFQSSPVKYFSKSIFPKASFIITK